MTSCASFGRPTGRDWTSSFALRVQTWSSSRCTVGAAKTDASKGCSSQWASRTPAAGSSRARSRWTSSRPRRCFVSTTSRRPRTTWHEKPIWPTSRRYTVASAFRPSSSRAGRVVGRPGQGDGHRVPRGRDTGRARLRRRRAGRAFRPGHGGPRRHPRRPRARRDRGHSERRALRPPRKVHARVSPNTSARRASNRRGCAA